MPGQYNVPQKKRRATISSTVAYTCPHRCKTLKRVERIYHLIRPRIRLADPFFSNSLLQILPWQVCAVPTKLFNLCVHQDSRRARIDPCAIPPWQVARTVSKKMGSPSVRSTMTHPRQTEPYIVMTKYNEDDSLLTRTIQGVVKNTAYLCNYDRSKTWGKDGWKKVFVHIVSDSRRKIDSRTLGIVAAIGTHQGGIVTMVVDGRPVAARIYEYTT